MQQIFHRITEWSGLAGPSMGHPSQPPAEAGSPRAGCTAPCPGGSGISPEKETPEPPWEMFHWRVEGLSHPVLSPHLPHLSQKWAIQHETHPFAACCAPRRGPAVTQEMFLLLLWVAFSASLFTPEHRAHAAVGSAGAGACLAGPFCPLSGKPGVKNSQANAINLGTLLAFCVQGPCVGSRKSCRCFLLPTHGPWGGSTLRTGFNECRSALGMARVQRAGVRQHLLSHGDQSTVTPGRKLRPSLPSASKCLHPKAICLLLPPFALPLP